MPCIFINFKKTTPPVPAISTILLDSTTTNGTSDMVSTQEINFLDSGGSNSNYSSGEEYNYTFNNASGQGFEIEVSGAFSFEHSSSSMWDRLGILVQATSTSSFTEANVTWLHKSAITGCPWSNSYGSGGNTSTNGWIFPRTNQYADQSTGWDGSSNIQLTNILKIKFCFYSDGSVVRPGWNLTIKAL